MVLACESIFSWTSLDGRPQNLHTFSKVNLKYTKCSFPVGQARCSFHLPHSYNLQILLARGNWASTNVEPCSHIGNLVQVPHCPGLYLAGLRQTGISLKNTHLGESFTLTFEGESYIYLTNVTILQDVAEV